MWCIFGHVHANVDCLLGQIMIAAQAVVIASQGGEHVTRRGDLEVRLDQVAAASAPGPPCLGVSLVHDTLELNYCTKLFHQTVHALSGRSCKTRPYTNVVCCSLKIPPLKLSPGVWYPRVISP